MLGKVFFLLLICCYVLCNLDVAMACIKNGNGCQPDGSQGNCCSGNCVKQSGWVAGYCK